MGGREALANGWMMLIVHYIACALAIGIFLWLLSGG